MIFGNVVPGYDAAIDMARFVSNLVSVLGSELPKEEVYRIEDEDLRHW